MFSESKGGLVVKIRTIGLGILALMVCAGAGYGFLSGTANARTGYTDKIIKGKYAFSFSVAVPEGSAGTDFIGGAGVYRADGAGNLTGTESYNSTVGGTDHQCTDVAISGTYTVNPDGTGTDAITLSSSDPSCTGSFSQALVIAEHGKEVKATNLQNGFVLIAGDWTRQ